MAHRVSLSHTEQEFMVEQHESVLDAAIRVGVAVDYGCTTGNCGLCLARVIQGEVKKLKHHDYVIPTAQKAQGFALMCSNTAITDLVIEASVADRVEDIPVQRFRAKTRRLKRVSDDLIILHLQTPRTNRLRFLAGQYATLSLVGIGELDASIASCPCDNKHLEFHIRRIEQQPFSDYVFEDLKVGDWVDVAAPKGNFVLKEGSPRPLILIAFDTGFAAIKSLLEHATAQEQSRDLHLLWIACGQEGQYLHNLCRSWQDALDEFHYTPLSIPNGLKEMTAQHKGGLALIEEQLLTVAQTYSEMVDFDAYVAAPEPIRDAVRKILSQCGLPESRFMSEPIRGNHKASCIGGH